MSYIYSGMYLHSLQKKSCLWVAVAGGLADILPVLVDIFLPRGIKEGSDISTAPPLNVHNQNS